MALYRGLKEVNRIEKETNYITSDLSFEFENEGDILEIMCIFPGACYLLAFSLSMVLCGILFLLVCMIASKTSRCCRGARINTKEYFMIWLLAGYGLRY